MIDVSRDFDRMQDYIVGRLSDSEQRAFEERLVRDAGLVRELEQSLRLREGLQLLRLQGYFEKGAARSARSRLWMPALAAAALAGVALLLAVHPWVQPATRPQPPARSASLLMPTAAGDASPVRTFTFLPLRGDPTPRLDLPARGPIELRADPAEVPATRYRLTLERLGQTGSVQALGTLTDLIPAADHYLHARVEAADLIPGVYRLRVTPAAGSASPPADATAAGQVFRFELRAPARP